MPPASPVPDWSQVAFVPIPSVWEKTMVDEAEDIAEEEGLPQVSYDPDQQARLDWMLQVRPLIGLDPSQMSEQAANEAAAQLRTLLANRP